MRIVATTLALSAFSAQLASAESTSPCVPEPIEGASISVSDINDVGEVVGLSWTLDAAGQPTGTTSAFLWRRGDMHILENLPNSNSSMATAVNDAGIVVGVSGPLGTADLVPVAWIHGRPLQLRVPEGATWAQVIDVNNRGQILGSVYTGEGTRCLIWTHPRSRPMDLGISGCSPAAFNDRGVVVGYVWAADGRDYAFRWADGRLEELRTPPGMVSSWPSDINHDGTIVGSASDTTTASHAVVWPTPDAPIVVDLGTSIATDINDRGDVAVSKFVNFGMGELDLITRDGGVHELASFEGAPGTFRINNRRQATWFIGGSHPVRAFVCRVHL